MSALTLWRPRGLRGLRRPRGQRTLMLIPYTLHPKPYTLNSKPQTSNPKFQTPESKRKKGGRAKGKEKMGKTNNQRVTGEGGSPRFSFGVWCLGFGFEA